MTREEVFRFNQSLALSINFYLALYLADDDLFYDSIGEDKNSEALTLLFLHTFIQRHHDRFTLVEKENSPLIVVPLLRLLLDASLILSLASKRKDVDSDRLPGKEEIALFLNEDVKSFLRRFGEDEAKEELRKMSDT